MQSFLIEFSVSRLSCLAALITFEAIGSSTHGSHKKGAQLISHIFNRMFAQTVHVSSSLTSDRKAVQAKHDNDVKGHCRTELLFIMVLSCCPFKYVVL